MSYSLEHFFRIYNDAEGVCLQVRPHPDLPDAALELSSCASKESKAFYGEFSVTLMPRQAHLLAEALRLAADRIPEK